MLLNWYIWITAELSVWQRPVFLALVAGSVLFPSSFSEVAGTGDSCFVFLRWRQMMGACISNWSNWLSVKH